MLGRQPTFKYIFLFLDVIVLSISFALSLADNYSILPSKGTNFFKTVFSSFELYIALVAVSLSCFLYFDLYKRNYIITIYRQTILILKSLLITGIVAIVVLFLSFNFHLMIVPFRKIVLQYILYSLLFSFVFRALLARSIFILLADKKVIQRKVLIVGCNKAGKYIGKSLEKSIINDFVIVGYLDDTKPPGETVYNNYRNLGTLKTIKSVVSETKVDEILIAIDNLSYDRLIEIVEKCLETNKMVRIYSNVLRVIAEKLRVELYADIPVVMLSQRPIYGKSWIFKRILDIILSSVALIVLFPFFVIIGIGIKISSPKGSIFFKQTRIGKNGKPFQFYKFRSMHQGKSNKEHIEFVQDFIKNTDKCDKKDIRIFKIQDDPRIFKFGRFIRKTSIDEFPQFFNVFKGDMSLVGPRPCLPYEWDCYSDWHKMRLNVVPGCTGLWQAVGRSTVTFEEMVILDLYYKSNMSLWLDLKILLLTIPVIFFAKGAH